MKLITKSIAKKIPALYSTDELPGDKKMAVVKFFGGGSFTFYVFEANVYVKESPGSVGQYPLADAVKENKLRNGWEEIEFFGYVTGVAEPELTYMTLSQLQEMRFPPFNLPVERDLYYTPESLATIKARGH